MLELTKDNFKTEVLEAKGPVIVDFNAEWCGPCQAQAPIIEEAAEVMGNSCKFASVNIDDEDELAEQYEIASIPCLILFRDGKEVDRKVGLQNVKKLIKWVE